MKTTPFHDFLTELFDKGKIVFRAAPRDRPSPAGVAVLAEAFETYCLAVAGPRIAFDPEIACAVAEFLRQAAWALVNHDDRMTDVVKRLKMPRPPLTPSHHLSADLTLRHLPQVLRRGRGLDPADPLVAQVANELTQLAAFGSSCRYRRGPPCRSRFRRSSRAQAPVCGAAGRK